MVPMPDGLQFLVPTQIAPILTTPLLSWATKARMAAEYFRRPTAAPRGRIARSPNSSPITTGRRRSNTWPSRFSPASTAGHPETLSVASVLPRFVELESKYGSLSKGMLAERRAAAATAQPLFRTLKGGLGSLVDALQPSIEPQRPHDLTAKSKRSSERPAGYRLRVSGEWLDADRVALACESHASARLASGIDPELAETPGRDPLHLVDRRRSRLRTGELSEASGRLRFPGSPPGAAPPGRLHVHGDEVSFPRS